MSRPIASKAELLTRGLEARELYPFSTLGTFSANERDAVALIRAQNTSRLQHLLPLRSERMLASPFAFYRGTAGLMAHDMAAQGDTGIDLVLCGDAHISNFGLFASPERTLMFDLNDFDEAAAGPWEWDVRRLLASVVLGARSINLSEEQVVNVALRAAEAYRRNLRQFMELPAYERLFVVRDERQAKALANQEKSFKIFLSAAKKARKRTQERASRKMLVRDEQGRSTFLEHPPVLVREEKTSAQHLEHLYERYLATARPDIALMLSTFTLTDVALRVVGVGSVGTRCYLLALSGPAGEQLILQIKEAQRSVIETALQRREPTIRVLPPDAPQGERVTTYQQILQAASDPFLGHVEDGKFHFYVRQFRDQKGSIDIDGMNEDQFDLYVRACASSLARAHSQSPLAFSVLGYLGDTDESDQALVRWSLSYADQSQQDFEAFRLANAGQSEA